MSYTPTPPDDAVTHIEGSRTSLTFHLESFETLVNECPPTMESSVVRMMGLNWSCNLTRIRTSDKSGDFMLRYSLSCTIKAKSPLSAECSNETSCFTCGVMNIFDEDKQLLMSRKFPVTFSTTGYYGPQLVIPFRDLTDIWSVNNLLLEICIEVDQPKSIRKAFVSSLAIPESRGTYEIHRAQIAGLTDKLIYVCVRETVFYNEALILRTDLSIFVADIDTPGFRRVMTLPPHGGPDERFRDFSADLNFACDKIGLLGWENHVIEDHIKHLYFRLVDLNTGMVDNWPVSVPVDLGLGGPARFGDTILGWVAFARDDRGVYEMKPVGTKTHIVTVPEHAYQVRLTYYRIFCLQSGRLHIFDFNNPEIGWRIFEPDSTYAMRGVLCAGNDSRMPIVAHWRLDQTGKFLELMLKEKSFVSWTDPFINIPEFHPCSTSYYNVRFRAGKMAWLTGQTMSADTVRIVDLCLPTFHSLKELATRAVRQEFKMTEKQIKDLIGYKGPLFN